MNERDQELLDKQLWGVSPSPPPRSGGLALAFVAAFFGGLLIGGILFPNKSNQVQVTTGDTPTALSLLDNSQATLR
ncbi:MAG TPA: hypothetical protein VIY07_14225 [Pseudolabrys sp.]